MRLRNWIGLAACGLLALSGCGGGETESPRAQGSGAGPSETRTSTGETSNPDGGVAAGACARAVSYRGNTYYDLGVKVVPRASGPILTGILPGCDDGGGAGAESGEEIELAQIEGVAPEIALLWPQQPDAVFIREGFDGPLPPGLRLKPPTCEPRDEPIQLTGPWFGIFGLDGPDDLDLASPCDIKLFVRQSSVPRYERAFLVIRVPAGPERLLTRADIRSSLWEGTIELTVTCRDGRYVAESVTAYPPR